MKRNMFWGLAALVLALVVNVPSIYAQPNTKADVPFAFTIAQTSMSAGSYTISAVSDHVMQIRNNATNETVVIVATREESVKPQNPRLVFHKYGDRYFLVEAWRGSGDIGEEFPTSNLEKEVRTAYNNTGGGTEVVVALR